MIHKTRYPELGYEQHDKGLWRIMALPEGQAVGPHYASKAELLADLNRFASDYGLNGPSHLLDDWTDGKPGWDYEAVLRVNGVSVVQDGDWSLAWKHGCIYIGQTTEKIAREAAAVFVSLWLRRVSASFAEKLMTGYVMFLELQS